MITTYEINLEHITDGIILTGDSAATVETDTTIIRYFFFTATSLDYSSSIMYLEYDNSHDWNVSADVVECSNDPNGETHAIRVTVDKFDSTSTEPEQREIHLYGELFTDAENVSSPFNIYLRYNGCPVTPAEAGFILSYTTLEDISGEVFNIESAVTRNIEYFSGNPGEFVGVLVPESIGYSGPSTIGVIKDFIDTNRENKILNIVARKTWGEGNNDLDAVYDTDWGMYSEYTYPSISYKQCDDADSYYNERRIDIKEIIALPCGFMSGIYRTLDYTHRYSQAFQEGKFIFEEPLEVIGYHSFFFGKHFNCTDELPSPEDDDYISEVNRYGETQYISYNSDDGYVDNKLESTKRNDVNQREVVFDIAMQIDTIKTGSYLKIIGNQAFKRLKNLTSIDLEGSPLERIGMYAFEGCESLETVDIPDTVLFIGEGAFKNSGITGIRIPKNIEYIEEETFRNCAGLINVNFDDCEQLKKISRFAFARSGVVDITFPDSLERIERYAFKYCDSLNMVQFGAGLKRIARKAFEHCNSLSRIVFTGTGATIDNAVFDECGKIGRLEIAQSTILEEDAFRYCGNDAIIIIDKMCKFNESAFHSFKTKEVHFLAKSESDMPSYSDGYYSYPKYGLEDSYYDYTREMYLVDLYIEPEIWALINNGQPKTEDSFLWWLERRWMGENARGDVYVRKTDDTYEVKRRKT